MYSIYAIIIHLIVGWKSTELKTAFQILPRSFRISVRRSNSDTDRDRPQLFEINRKFIWINTDRMEQLFPFQLDLRELDSSLNSRLLAFICFHWALWLDVSLSQSKLSINLKTFLSRWHKSFEDVFDFEILRRHKECQNSQIANGDFTRQKAIFGAQMLQHKFNFWKIR